MIFTKRAAPHKTSSGFIVAIGKHFMSLIADRCSVFVDPDGIRDRFGMPAFAVKVNKGTDIAFIEQCISWKVIHCRIKAHIFAGKIRHMFFQFMEGNQGIDGIMPSGTGKTEKQRKIRVQFFIVERELEEGISIIIFVKVTVPSSGSIGVRIMTGSRIIGRCIACVQPAMMSSWIGMGMDGRTIAGDGQVFFRDESGFHRGENGNKIEEFLKPCFKIKRDIFPVHNPIGKDFRYFGFCFGSFLPFAFWFFRFFRVP